MSTEPRWLSDDEQFFWRQLLAARGKLMRVVEDSLIASSELSSPEFSVLVKLSEAEEHCMRLRDLCNELEWDRSRASHQITRMERRELVTKEKSVSDGRGVVVRLTDTGMKCLERAVPDHVETVRRAVFDHLDPADIPAIRRFFDGILASEEVAGREEAN
ncbi:MarR family winged helix-turn-helix transcriptional regulator [Corynebacterium sp. P8-C1]|uniref:MarR family winged helix-turn-helix transcriptional regulator n=1 Tax=Corynebacterium sp. P8-C1 TaxID=3059082 RepID=UPI00265D1E96|nr:MarR family winged helix-turn-helix transcriptional regulator [Corynebacterium sp. P8-C1]WKK63739.1 MarR family winged helix-turn-helix transcriptional regulator [Corynebacterium sp. P8-C1]